MRKNIPSLPPDLAPAERPSRRLRGGPALRDIGVTLRTVTPVLGGGPAPRRLDEVEPVRGPSLRGALRFFWRALHGHEYGDPAELALAEAALWGQAAGAQGGRSLVEVQVRVETRSVPDPEDISFRDEAAYALWPARGTRGGRGQGPLPPAPRWQPGLVFHLAVRAPVDRALEVERALCAFILFGGYGARTRRGCGSLAVTTERERWLPRALTQGELRRLLGPEVLGRADWGRAGDLPLLRGAVLHAGPPRDARGAWTAALSWLRDFRQGRAPRPDADAPGKYARRYGERNRPGRSDWPEADKIRRLSGRGPWAHEPRVEYSGPPAWPRAGFGLPIIGQFRSDYDRPEPRPFELQWRRTAGGLFEDYTRLASPLIVKALPLADGKFAPIALWLYRSYPRGGQVVLRRQEWVAGSAAPFDRMLGEGDRALYAPLRGAGSLREAFLGWLVAQGVREVGP